ncbi:MAG: hypothetical protein ACRDJ3_01485 [Solirubrobacteraceae bacterium]
MPNIRYLLRTPAASALAVLALTGFGFAGCGGSSSSSQTNAAATSVSSATTSTEKGNSSGTSTEKNGGSNGPSGANSPNGRFSAMRECLRKSGITLPAPPTGSGRSRGGLLGGVAGGQLPKGVTRAQLQAAIAKCGGGRFGGPGGRPGNFRRANSPVFKKALAAYSACLRQNGVKLPPPNTSGKGPVFSAKGLNTSSPQFKSATTKCRGVLLSAFRARGQAPGA